ncbi:MAG: oxidoreductase, partial [Mycobacterium sp.]
MAAPSIAARMGAGVAAAAVTLGVAQLVSAFVSPASDVRTAVGTAVVNLTPGAAKEWAIQIFGTSDKLFLATTMLAVIAVLAAVAATGESRRVPWGTLAMLAAGAAGCVAVLAQVGARPLDVIPTIVGVLCGVGVLRLLTA